MPKRMTIVMVIESTAPMPPTCFPTRDVWHDWLRIAHQSGLSVLRRADTGKWSGDRHAPYEVKPTAHIDFCTDCSNAYRQRMEADGKCHPSAAAKQRMEHSDGGTACVDPAP